MKLTLGPERSEEPSPTLRRARLRQSHTLTGQQ